MFARLPVLTKRYFHTLMQNLYEAGISYRVSLFAHLYGIPEYLGYLTQLIFDSIFNNK